jgi:hypothetical protein
MKLGKILKRRKFNTESVDAGSLKLNVKWGINCTYKCNKIMSTSRKMLVAFDYQLIRASRGYQHFNLGSKSFVLKKCGIIIFTNFNFVIGENQEGILKTMNLTVLIFGDCILSHLLI